MSVVVGATPVVVEEELRLSKKFGLFSSRPTAVKVGWGSKSINLVYSLPDPYSNSERDYLTSITLPHGEDDDWLGSLGDLSSRVPLASNLTWILDNHARHGSRLALRIETFANVKTPTSKWDGGSTSKASGTNDIVAVVERFERPCKFILSRQHHGPLCLKLSTPDNHSSYKWLLYVAEKPPQLFDVGRYGTKPNLEGIDPHDYFHVHETFGEGLATIQWPKAFIATNNGDVFPVVVLPPHTVVVRAIFDESDCSPNGPADEKFPTFKIYLLTLEISHRRLGLKFAANRPKRLLHVKAVMTEDQQSCEFIIQSSSATPELIGDIACFKGWLFALRYQKGAVPTPLELGSHSGPAYLVCARALDKSVGDYEWHQIPGFPVLFPGFRSMRSEFLGELSTLLVPTIRKFKWGWLALDLRTWDGESVPSVKAPGRFLDTVVDFFCFNDGDRDCFKMTTVKTDFMADMKFTHYSFDDTHPERVKQLNRVVKWYPNARNSYCLGLNWSSVPGFCYYRRLLGDSSTPENRRPGRPRVALHLHGGPHSLAARTYIPSQLLIADEMDWDLILCPNYRGSLGVSEQHWSQLAGHVGVMDVSDCRKFLLDHLSLIFQGKVDSAKSDEEIIEAFSDVEHWPQIVCLGGSHGGFLAAHLIGQHPLLFSAAVLMNPVTDLVTGATTSDISDVLEFECDATTHLVSPPEVSLGAHSQLCRRDMLTKASPLLWVTEVVAPVVVFLGGSDVRVPPAQGRAYYHALRALGKKAELYYYPESDHSISEPRNSEHFVISTIQFLQRNLLQEEHLNADTFLQIIHEVARDFPKPDKSSKPESVLYIAS